MERKEAVRNNLKFALDYLRRVEDGDFSKTRSIIAVEDGITELRK